MKINLKYFMKKSKLPVIILFLLLWGVSSAQEKKTTVEKKASSVQLTFYKKADQTKTARVKVTAKNEMRKFMPAMKAHVNFYVVDNKAEALVGVGVTALDGKCEIKLPGNLPLDGDMKSTIIAKIENDPAYEDAQDQGSFKDARLSLTISPTDTNRVVTVKAMETGKDGKDKPIANATVNFYVKRMFGTMPAAEDRTATTDENGEGTFILAKDLKGDTAGNLTIVAKIEDNELYGNVEANHDVKFGIPLQVETDPFPRALWEPRAPAPLVITISVIFSVVWFVYLTLFYRMYKISQDKNPSTPTGKPPYELSYED